ncbi:MAG: NADH:ubiquinone reductase (Na(+)-transporting) subunit B [Bacteriovoracaceae bacterium]|nr:NADH:ubiquinone reductase (Na(+)-transporting) subunit B [Bacteriovoracaceae bacterium]
MKFLRDTLDKLEEPFTNGKLKFFYPFYEAADTFFYNTSYTTKGSVHVRDGLDLKRMMTFVMFALIPCIIMGVYNVGWITHVAVAKGATAFGWRVDVMDMLGLALNNNDMIANFVHGLLYFLPIYITAFITGLVWEVFFCMVRKHEVSEGFFVTSMLFPLIVPPTVPLWQIAIAMSFAVVIGKEVFGGTGMNFMNPAVLARAFLFFAYPSGISGDKVWIAVDGFSGATPLSLIAAGKLPTIASSDTISSAARVATDMAAPYMEFSFLDAFMGQIPGSIGEVSTLACILGAIFLIYTGIGSWRIMLGTVLGAVGMALIFNVVGSDTNPMFAVNPLWHLALGGFAFGTVFMATDPVTASQTQKGRWIYGILIGVLCVLIRGVNSAYPEGMMLAILLGNIFAPLIDHFVIESDIKKRGRSYAK